MLRELPWEGTDSNQHFGVNGHVGDFTWGLGFRLWGLHVRAAAMPVHNASPRFGSLWFSGVAVSGA